MRRRGGVDAINQRSRKMMTEKKATEREVGRVKAYIFGCYNSRGGAALVLADHHKQALDKYLSGVFAFRDDEEERARFLAEYHGDRAEAEAAWAERCASAIDGAEDNFIGRVVAIICDAPLPEETGTELDAAYLSPEEQGYRYGRVQSRYEIAEYDYEDKEYFQAHRVYKRLPSGRYSEWMETRFFVLWRGEAPEIQLPQTPLKEEFQIVPEELGEDGFGLVLIK
jgi:hypothetical protein